jgi:phosphoribosylformylglycinamidine synthase
VDLDVDELCLDRIRHEVEDEGGEEPEGLNEAGYSRRIFNVLFSEEAGAVLQVRQSDTQAVMQAFFDAGLRGEFFIIGQTNDLDRLRVTARGPAGLR